jgi:hypothetical protein
MQPLIEREIRVSRLMESAIGSWGLQNSIRQMIGPQLPSLFTSITDSVRAVQIATRPSLVAEALAASQSWKQSMAAQNAQIAAALRPVVFDAVSPMNATVQSSMAAGLLGPAMEMAAWKNDFARSSVFGLATEMAAWKNDFVQSAMVGQLSGLAAWQDDIARLVATWQAPTEWMRSARRAAQALSEKMFFAVAAAQDAALREDINEVAAFFDRWTDLPRSKRNARMWAGAQALLEVDLAEFGLDDGFDLIELVEKRANRQFRRGSRRLGETTLNHRSVVSMERVMTVLDAEQARCRSRPRWSAGRWRWERPRGHRVS